MRSVVLFVEINVYEGMAPLVSGYLQGYACREPLIRERYEFHKYATCRKSPLTEMLATIEQTHADIYAFSCYVWNIGLIKALLPPLLAGKPNATFVLGGPQVMHHAEQYLAVGNERMLVCNGEGERIFAAVLRELLEECPDFERVKGVSFYRGGELVTTEREERISDLDEIPSPFLTGLIDPAYRMSVIETNRGCPFRCGFCYWGAANNDRVYQFSQQRVQDELTWLAENEVPVVHIADANWGMLKRDIDLSRHIAKCKSEHFYPFAVIFAAAKNSPARVTEVTRVFTDAGLINTQPISMQSLDETTLDIVDRKNIKLGAYSELQADLNERSIGSYIELIWPLPGETLSSFKAGIEKLCERKAASIIVYAHLLLHNTPIYKNREALGLVTRKGYDDTAEADIIVATNDVDYDDFTAGMWFIYGLNALHNTHLFQGLSSYLHHSGIAGYAELLNGFVAFCQAEPEHPFTRFCTDSIEHARYYDFTNYPAVYHMVLHGERDAFADLWRRFCSTQTWWADNNARALFELDLLGKPFLYRDTPSPYDQIDFELVRIVDGLPRGSVVELPEVYLPLVEDHVPGVRHGSRPDERFLRIEHPPIPYPFDPSKSEEDIADYCSGMITRMMSILPTWTAVAA